MNVLVSHSAVLFLCWSLNTPLARVFWSIMLVRSLNLSVPRSVHQEVILLLWVLLISQFVGLSVGGIITLFACRLMFIIGKLVGWLFCYFVGGLSVGLLVGWFVSLLVCPLVSQAFGGSLSPCFFLVFGQLFNLSCSRFMGLVVQYFDRSRFISLSIGTLVADHWLVSWSNSQTVP